MEIQCTTCKAVYRIPDSKVSEKGVYARCVKCQTRFFVPGKHNHLETNSLSATVNPAKSAGPTQETIVQHNHENKNPENLPVCTACGKHEPDRMIHIDKHRIFCKPCYQKSISEKFVKYSSDKVFLNNPKSKAKKPQYADVGLISRMWRLLKNLVLSFISQDMAIDLGTINTLIYIKGKGIVLNEPSVVTMIRNGARGGHVMAVGKQAWDLMGRTPPHITTIRPMRDGVIANFEVAGEMLRHFVKKIRNRWTLMKPVIIVAVPTVITRVEKRAVEESMLQAGARKVYLIQEPVSASIGADLIEKKTLCSMVVDIGGGTTDVAVISATGIVSGRSVKIAGNKMDDAIIRYIKNKFNYIIGERTAENLKMTIGNAYPFQNEIESIEVKGWDILTGKPKKFTVNSLDMYEAISENLKAIVNTIKTVLDMTPHELTQELTETGIYLTGGGAYIKNLDILLKKETELPIHITENPLLTVAQGAGKAIEKINDFGHLFMREDFIDSGEQIMAIEETVY